MPFKRFMNATFVWWNDRAKTDAYPLTPLMSEGNVLSNNVLVNSLRKPIPMFLIYKDGRVGIEVLNTLYNRNDVKFAVGGIALHPFTSFEGFKESNIPSLAYKTDRIAIAYNPKTNKIAMCSGYNMNIYDFRDRLKELGFSIILGLDSGGSAQWKFDYSKRLTGRYMWGWVYWR